MLKARLPIIFVQESILKKFPGLQCTCCHMEVAYIGLSVICATQSFVQEKEEMVVNVLKKINR